MPKTPPALSLLGIALTVLAIATGSWLSAANNVDATIDWPTDIAIDVRDDLAQVEEVLPNNNGTDCSERSELLTVPGQSRMASGISTT